MLFVLEANWAPVLEVFPVGDIWGLSTKSRATTLGARVTWAPVVLFWS